MLFGNTVIDFAAVAARGENSGDPHFVEVLGHRALPSADGFGDVTGLAFAVKFKVFQNLQTLRMADDFDHFGDRIEKIRR